MPGCSANEKESPTVKQSITRASSAVSGSTGKKGGEETNKYTATNAITKHDNANSYARVI